MSQSGIHLGSKINSQLIRAAGSCLADPHTGRTDPRIGGGNQSLWFPGPAADPEEKQTVQFIFLLLEFGAHSSTSSRSVSPSLHDDVRLDVEQEVVVTTAHLQEEGRLLQQRLLQVGGVHQRAPVQLHDDVTVPDPASGQKGKRLSRRNVPVPFWYIFRSCMYQCHANTLHTNILYITDQMKAPCVLRASFTVTSDTW